MLMYGWINSCIEALVLEKFGEAIWTRIKKEAGIPPGTHWYKHCEYEDAETLKLVAAASNVLKAEAPVVLKLFGEYFIRFVLVGGYEGLLRSLGTNLREWLSNVNLLHDHMKNSLPAMVAPRFWLIEDEQSDSFLLYYYSHRGPGLHPIVEGVVETVARDYFSSEVSMQLLHVQGDGCEQTAWRVHQSPLLDSAVADEAADCDRVATPEPAAPPPRVCPFSGAPLNIEQISTTLATATASVNAEQQQQQQQQPQEQQIQKQQMGLALSVEQLDILFPFHIILRDGVVVQVGSRLQELCTVQLAGQPAAAVCDVISSAHVVEETWGAVLGAAVKEVRGRDAHGAGIVATDLRVRLRRQVLRPQLEPLVLSGPLTAAPAGAGDASNGGVVYFTCQPVVVSIEQLHVCGIGIDDLPRSGTDREMLLMHQHVASEKKHALHIERMARQLDEERLRTLDVKRCFVRYTSHEIRTPLMVAQMSLPIIRYSRSLLEGSDAEAVKDALSDCSTSLEVATQILNDLLDYEKLESGIFQLHNQCFHDAVAFATENVKFFSSSAEAKQIKIRHDNRCIWSPPATAHNNLLLLYIDVKKANQVVRNFMSNALKFTPEGGEVTVVLSTALTIESAFSENAKVCSSSAKTHSNLLTRFIAEGGAAPAADPEAQAAAAAAAAAAASSPRSPLSKYSSVGVEQLSVDSSDGAMTAEGVSPCGYFVVEIRDSGAGISVENQERLFNEIVQFNPHELQGGGGSGLGLWISKEIVMLHGGAVAVSSDGVGRGSSFYLCLPAYKKRSHATGASAGASAADGGGQAEVAESSGAHPAKEMKSSLRAAEGAQQGARKFHFLVVDDSAPIRKLMRASIAAAGHDCEVAEDGDVAVEMVRESMLASTAVQDGEPARGGADGMVRKKYDAILMDLVMIRCHGPEAASAIRGLGFAGPLLGITGNSQAADEKRFRRAGANAVLTKPVRFDQIMECLSRYI